MTQIPSPAEIEHAARLLRAGRLVVFPTETVYGLGANALDPEAVARIYAVKGRPPTSPLIVHVASIEMAKELVATWPETAERLAGKFWPGPLTLVLPKARSTREFPWSDGPSAAKAASSATVGGTAKAAPFPKPVSETGSEAMPHTGSGIAVKKTIPDIVTAGLATVGLRMPAHPIAQALITAAEVPLAAPSANRFTELSPTTVEHVRRSLGSEVDLILDGGPCPVGIESTVVSLAESQPVLLRPGGVLRAALEALIGPMTVAEEIVTGAHPSPGMHARHYSPRTSLLLVADGKLPGEGRGIYLQHTCPVGRQPGSGMRANIQVIQMPQAPEAYAAALYENLHQADEANADWIAVDQPPNTAEWEAVNDRLRRAGTKS